MAKAPFRHARMQPMRRATKLKDSRSAKPFKSVLLRPMKREDELRITRSVLARIDMDDLMKEARDICAEFSIRLTDEQIMVAVYRAITGVVRAWHRRSVTADHASTLAVQMLPHCLSEVILGLAVVHSRWDTMVHAPALTYLPVLSSAWSIGQPRHLPGEQPALVRVPDATTIRESQEFAYALGRLTREQQSLQVNRSASNSEILSIGNKAMFDFFSYYQIALAGNVDLKAFCHDVEDGRAFVAELHDLLLNNIGCESGPALPAPTESCAEHPVIAASVAIESALEDVKRRRELHENLIDKLTVLTHRQFEVWYHHYVSQLSRTAGARRMGIKLSTYQTHLRRLPAGLEQELFVNALVQTFGPAQLFDLIRDRIAVRD